MNKGWNDFMMKFILAFFLFLERRKEALQETDLTVKPMKFKKLRFSKTVFRLPDEMFDPYPLSIHNNLVPEYRYRVANTLLAVLDKGNLLLLLWYHN